MLRIIRLVFQSLIARISGWHLCGAVATDRQSGLLRRLCVKDPTESLTIPDCFATPGGEPSSSFFTLRGISMIAEILRDHPERLFWLKPAPEYLIVRHALSGEEVWIDARGCSSRTATEDELFSK